MYQNDVNLQTRQLEAPRRPCSRRKSSTTDSHRHGQTSGSSLKTLFSRTMSFKASPTSTITERPAIFRASSSQLGPPEYSSTRLPSLVSNDSRVTTSSTTESCWAARPRTSWDPPPLFQAYSQALRHALLGSPSASVGFILRQQALSTISGGSTTPTNLEEASTFHKTKKYNKKSLAFMDSAWTRKLYILVTSGYILQYAADGHHDRLPEKILPLRYNSVAFASDAIPGRPYVLQVSRVSDQDDERVDTNTRNLWSRIGFRTAEEKRTAGSFLLVCESPDELDAWMIAVRREIEAQGGAQYRCNTPRAEHGGTIPVHQLTHRSQQAIQQISGNWPDRAGPEATNQPSDKVTAQYEPLPEIKTSPGLWSDQAFFRRPSSMDSSVNTATELDDLREASQCSSSTATGHRLSLDESRASLSPAEEIFKEKYTALAGSNRTPPVYNQDSPVREAEIGIWSQSPLSPTQISVGHSEQLRLSVCDPEGRVVSIVPNFSLPKFSQRYSRCSITPSEASSPAMSEVLDIVDPAQAFDTESSEESGSTRPISTIAPLPSRETLVRNPRSRTISGERASSRASLASTTLASSPSPLGQQSITDIEATYTTRAAAYSLFPKRHSSCNVLGSSLDSSPPMNDLCELAQAKSHKRSFSTPRSEEPANLLSVTASRRMRRPASMQIDLKSSLDIEKPERSPEVTDLHFATNFGTTNPFNRSSSILGEMSSSCVPQLEAVKADMQGATRPTQRLTASGSAIIGPPAGPPPTCPLPEPPSVHICRSSAPARLYSPRRIFLDLTIDD